MDLYTNDFSIRIGTFSALFFRIIIGDTSTPFYWYGRAVSASGTRFESVLVNHDCGVGGVERAFMRSPPKKRQNLVD